MNTAALCASEVSFSGRCTEGPPEAGHRGRMRLTDRYLVGAAAASSLRSSSGGLLDVPFTTSLLVLPGGGPLGGARATASEEWGGTLEGLPQIKRKQQVLSTGSGLALLAPDQGPPHSDLTPDDLRWSSCNNHGNKVHNECNAPNHSPFAPKIVFHGSLVPKQLGTPLDYSVGGWGTGSAGSTLCRRSSWRRCGPVSPPSLHQPQHGAWPRILSSTARRSGDPSP